MWRRVVNYGKDLFAAISSHNTGVLAAVIAYFVFSSMIPVLLLVIYGGSVAIPQSYINHFLSEFLKTYVPTGPEYRDLVQSTVAHLEEVRGSLTLIGLFGLLWNTIGGLVSFQYILDVIWEVRRRRGFIRQYVVGLLSLVFLVLLTALSALVDTLAPQIAKYFDPRVSPLHWLLIVHGTAQVSFPILLFITCFFCYRYLPSARLPQPLLWIGAALSTVAIYISHLLFLFYTRHLGNYTVVYGSLAFIMLLLFWIYILSAIILFVGEIIVTIYKVRERQHQNTILPAGWENRNS